MKKILLGITLALFLLTTAASAAVAQQASTPSFSFEPSEVTVKPGDTFSTNIIMDTTGQGALGGGAQITYDPNVVTIIEVKQGSVFAEYPAAVFDNETGLAKISGIASGIDDTFKGAGTFGSITWKLNAAEETSAKFVFTPGSTTDSNIAVTTGNGDILGQVGELVIRPEGGAVVNVQSNADEMNEFSNAAATSTTGNTISSEAGSGGSSFYLLGLLGLIVFLGICAVVWFLMKRRDKDKTPPATGTTSVSAASVSSPVNTFPSPNTAMPQPPQGMTVPPQAGVVQSPVPTSPVVPVLPTQPVQGTVSPPSVPKIS